MKPTLILPTIAMLFLGALTNVNAQDWSTFGNPSITPGIHLLGTTDTSPIPFGTNSIERMRLTANGNLGINTTNPIGLFHVSNGAVVFDGATGANPNPASGPQMVWIPALGSLLAGTETANEWDNPNVGANSFAFGQNISIPGNDSFSAGLNNSSTAGATYVLGQSSGNTARRTKL